MHRETPPGKDLHPTYRIVETPEGWFAMEHIPGDRPCARTLDSYRMFLWDLAPRIFFRDSQSLERFLAEAFDEGAMSIRLQRYVRALRTVSSQGFALTEAEFRSITGRRRYLFGSRWCLLVDALVFGRSRRHFSVILDGPQLTVDDFRILATGRMKGSAFRLLRQLDRFSHASQLMHPRVGRKLGPNHEPAEYWDGMWLLRIQSGRGDKREKWVEVPDAENTVLLRVTGEHRLAANGHVFLRPGSPTRKLAAFWVMEVGPIEDPLRRENGLPRGFDAPVRRTLELDVLAAGRP